MIPFPGRRTHDRGDRPHIAVEWTADGDLTVVDKDTGRRVLSVFFWAEFFTALSHEQKIEILRKVCQEAPR